MLSPKLVTIGCMLKPELPDGRVANKVGKGLADQGMGEDDEVGVWVWGKAEVADVSKGTQAAIDGRAGWGVNGIALQAGKNFCEVEAATEFTGRGAIGGGRFGGEPFGDQRWSTRASKGRTGRERKRAASGCAVGRAAQAGDQFECDGFA